MKTPTKFSERFKQLREEAELTQDQIALKLGILKTTVSKYENNRREPEYDALIKIANFFNVTIDYLLGNSDERKP